MSLLQTVLDGLEDHFAQTGEWWLCFKVIELKYLLNLDIYRSGWK